MMKAGENQSDYQLAASLYQHSLTTLKIADRQELTARARRSFVAAGGGL